MILKMKPLLLLAIPLLCASLAVADGQSGVAPLPAPAEITAPKDWKVTLEFARAKIAAGAVRNDAHQSEFTIKVLNSKEKPVVGTEISLPKITSGGQGPEDKKPPVATLEWKPEFAAKQSLLAKTDKKGEVKGIFTSGNRTEMVKFQAIGNATASLEQVWNELEDDFDYPDNEVDGLTIVGYTMAFKEGDREIPITGHKSHLEPTEIEVSVTDPTLGPDDDEDGKPDGESRTIKVTAENADDPFWKAFLQWSKWDYPMYEDKPGHYLGQYLVKVREGAIVAGLKIDDVSDVQFDFTDDVTFDEFGTD